MLSLLMCRPCSLNVCRTASAPRRYYRRSSRPPLTSTRVSPSAAPYRSCTRRCQDVSEWVDRTVLGLNLCPWARVAARDGLLQYVDCRAMDAAGVSACVVEEAIRLEHYGKRAWATTLVLCSAVDEWISDFAKFDQWLANCPELIALDDTTAFVAFHPDFRRWYGLAEGYGPGSRVMSYYEEVNGERSSTTLPAVILTAEPDVVGTRRVGVRFQDDGVEQWVPLEWLLPPALAEAPLLDNWMHRAPCPAVHLIRRYDLDALRHAEGSEEMVVKVHRRNSKLVSTLGEEGMRAVAAGHKFGVEGRNEPVLAYEYMRCRKGLTQHRKDLRASLLSWDNWPARTHLLRALERHSNQSGVVLVHGPGGAGKTELVEQVCTWAHSKGFTLLAGQNLDPSGTFALPRLCLQEAFRSLVQCASKDTYWRSQAWDLLCASLGSGNTSRSQSRNTTRLRHTARVPGHAELYWMLVAMLRASLGAEASVRLEPWAPLMSLVVTQLAFGPRMVSAMMERNEQHARASRLAKLCTAVLDGFARYGGTAPESGDCQGTVLLLHMRRSSAFFQSRDPQEFATIQAFADLCMRRKDAAHGQPEQRPLLLVIVSREAVLKDSTLQARVKEENNLVEAEDLNLIQTSSYVEHLLSPEKTKHSGRRTSRRPSQRPSFAHGSNNDPGASPMGASPMASAAQAASSFGGLSGFGGMDRRPSYAGHSTDRRPSLAGNASKYTAPSRPDIRTTEMICEYVHEVTGGNALGIETLFKEMERLEVLRRIREDPVQLALSPVCKDAQTLRSMVALPEKLVGMAFSTFERLNPREQMVLKTASTLNREFKLKEIEAALQGMIPPEDVRSICKKLVDPNARTLRKLPKKKVKKGPTTPVEDTFVFYSGLLRHAAQSLVLETQRTEVRRKTMQLTDISDLVQQHKEKPKGPGMEGVTEEDEEASDSSGQSDVSEEWS